MGTPLIGYPAEQLQLMVLHPLAGRQVDIAATHDIDEAGIDHHLTIPGAEVNLGAAQQVRAGNR